MIAKLFIWKTVRTVVACNVVKNTLGSALWDLAIGWKPRLTQAPSPLGGRPRPYSPSTLLPMNFIMRERNRKKKYVQIFKKNKNSLQKKFRTTKLK